MTKSSVTKNLDPACCTSDVKNTLTNASSEKELAITESFPADAQQEEVETTREWVRSELIPEKKAHLIPLLGGLSPSRIGADIEEIMDLAIHCELTPRFLAIYDPSTKVLPLLKEQCETSFGLHMEIAHSYLHRNIFGLRHDREDLLVQTILSRYLPPSTTKMNIPPIGIKDHKRLDQSLVALHIRRKKAKMINEKNRHRLRVLQERLDELKSEAPKSVLSSPLPKRFSAKTNEKEVSVVAKKTHSPELRSLKRRLNQLKDKEMEPVPFTPYKDIRNLKEIGDETGGLAATESPKLEAMWKRLHEFKEEENIILSLTPDIKRQNELDDVSILVTPSASGTGSSASSISSQNDSFSSTNDLVVSSNRSNQKKSSLRKKRSVRIVSFRKRRVRFPELELNQLNIGSQTLRNRVKRRQNT